MGKPIVVYVSTDGSDKAPGTRAKPVATLKQALKIVRAQRGGKRGGQRGGQRGAAQGATRRGTAPPEAVAAKILLKGGTHFLRSTLKIGKSDSGTAPFIEREKWEIDTGGPTVIMSAPGESATLSGGRVISGFKAAEINGVKALAASISSVKSGKWNFNHLWVNGVRAERTRLPESGLYRIESLVADRGMKQNQRVGAGLSQGAGYRSFTYAEGDLHAFENLTDVDFVATHFWVATRIPFSTIDAKKRTAELARSAYRLTDDFSEKPAPYYIENVKEALVKPGQWYLDRPTGTLYYIPKKGETADNIEVIAPVLETVVRVDNASHVHFRDLTFSHAEYKPDEVTRQINGQALPWVCGAVSFAGAERCSIRDCNVEHVGTYGVELIDGSVDCEVSNCTIQDLGAGGVKVFHTVEDDGKDKAARARGRGKVTATCSRIIISDNTIRDGGKYFRQAIGVLVGKCSGVQIVHNDIHDFDYSGVSVGWTWGYAESDAFGNIIEFNHIYNIGRGVLSDMGGIYHLGVSPGTRIRHNYIHDVESRGYGGWGIYTDEGSTDILIENNLVHDTSISGFDQHYGRRNVVRNNIFAYGKQFQVQISRIEPGHLALRFEKNIFYGDHPAMFDLKNRIAERQELLKDCVRTEDNIFFNEKSKMIDFAGITWTGWKKLGNERRGIIADPMFVNPGKRNFKLKKSSPAIKLGFIPFDPARAGRRPASEQGANP